MRKQVVWSVYAPNEAYDEKEMGYLMSFVGQAAENYLAQDRFEQDTMSAHLHKLEYFLENNLDKHYRAEYRKAEKWLEENPHRDSEWAGSAWRLADLEVRAFYQSKSRMPDLSIQQAASHLDSLYFAEKLRLSCELLNLNSILSAGFDLSIVNQLIQYLKHTGPHANPEINLRMHILQMLHHPEEKEAFEELLRLMPATPNYLPPTKVREVYAYAQNHCIRQIKNGNGAFLQALFEINCQSIEIGLIYETEYINPWNFKNIVSTALKLGHFDWTADFIQTHKEGLAAQFRTSAIAFNEAHLHFHLKEYDAALKALMKVEFSDVFYALDTRKLQLMIYFERGDAEPMLSLIASFKVFLRRNKVVSAQNREAYKHFVDWVARIFREREKSHPNIAPLVAEIRATSPLVEGDWLERQCTLPN